MRLDRLDAEHQAMFLDDVLSLVAQVEEEGLTPTDLMNGLRRSMRAYVYPESGRKWRNLPMKYDVVGWLERRGFTVTRGQRRGGGFEYRITL